VIRGGAQSPLPLYLGVLCAAQCSIRKVMEAEALELDARMAGGEVR
jgi:hypothetical protein